jgi:hypothetical protein
MTAPQIPLGRLCNSVPQFLQPIEFRVVRDLHEFNEAMRLVYREYVKRGYMKSNAAQAKHMIFQALPTTTTFIAKHYKTGIIGTITLVEDSPLGLPMDEIYKAEVDRLRKQQLHVAEASLLALDTSLFGKGVFTLFHAKKLLLTLRLFKTMFDYLRGCTRCDELVACFNPKHEVLYDFLQLKPLGELKYYSGANGNPAIARHMNIKETERKALGHPAYNLFFGRSSKNASADRLHFSPEALQWIFYETAPLLQSASPTELSYIRDCYPHYPFDAILAGQLETSALKP